MNIYFEVLHASPTCSFSVAKQGSLLGSPNDSSKGFRSSSNFSLPTVSSCVHPSIQSQIHFYNARLSNPARFSSSFVLHMVALFICLSLVIVSFLLLFSRSPLYHHFSLLPFLLSFYGCLISSISSFIIAMLLIHFHLLPFDSVSSQQPSHLSNPLFRLKHTPMVLSPAFTWIDLSFYQTHSYKHSYKS